MAEGGWGDLSLERVRGSLEAFAKERDWEQFHTPRNLLLALQGEVGEVSELFQWKGEVKPGLPGWSADDRRRVGEELSDVLAYTVRMADRCGIDLADAVARKMKKNAEKYPAGLCKGSSAKYTAYTGVTGIASDGSPRVAASAAPRGPPPAAKPARKRRRKS
eukprot:TRINITY_DN33371_c0_g1_i1.p1 TRINITY_DN33371_c0_g1~~TRINITY_DN33371_c0_g1_i1.p1  ORF type:complete len:176 (+),score=72.39 TRINITY_DN33371_c0_g1_i1:45-530(+)